MAPSTFSSAIPAYRAKSAAEPFGLIADGVLKVEINQRYRMAETALAHADLEGRGTTGSTALDPQGLFRGSSGKSAVDSPYAPT